MRKFTKEEEDDIVSMYKNGFSGNKIAIKYDVPSWKIQHTLDKYKIEKRKYLDYFVFTEAQEDALIKDFLSGVKKGVLSKTYKLSIGRITDILTKRGITEQEKIKKQKKENHICTLYKEGKPIDLIAATFGLSRATIFNVIAKHGLSKGKPKRTDIFSKEFSDLIVDLYVNKNKMLKDIAAEIGVSGHTVKVRLIARGIEIKRKRGITKRHSTHTQKPRTQTEYEKEIIGLYCDGNSSTSIGIKLAINQSKVISVLKKYNIKRRKHSDYVAKITPETEKLIKEMYKTKGLNQIAKELKFSVRKIKESLIKSGVELKKRNKWLETPLTEIDEMDIVNDYVKNLIPAHIIQKKYTIGQRRLSSILKKYGFVKRKSNDLNHFIMTEEKEKEILLIMQTETEIKDIQAKLSFKCGKEQIERFIRAKFSRKNGDGFYKTWKQRFGESAATDKIKKHKEKMSKATKGTNNPMFGKPSPQGSGNGWKGWYKGFYFRSLRELSYLLDLDDSNIPWSSGEAHKFDVPYINYDGTQRTYRPDFFVNNEKLVEIKPKRLQKTPNIMAKTAAAIEKCKEWGLKYEITDYKIQAEKIKKALDVGLVKFARDYEKRFLDYLEVTVLKSS